MKTSKFDRKIHGDDAKLKKGLKHHGWVMGYGWGSNGGTWKMGGWDRNIAPSYTFRGLKLPKHRNAHCVAH
jgi:hypothetical protein